MKPNTRVVLFQFRSNEKAKKQEVASFVRTGGLSEKELYVCDVLSQTPSVEHLRKMTGIILGGSPLHITSCPFRAELMRVLKYARCRGIPMLGVCFGAQFMADIWGGHVEVLSKDGEHGTCPVRLESDMWRENLFHGFPQNILVQQAHDDCIVAPPIGSVVLATGSNRTLLRTIQAFGFPGMDIYGVQFHPERSKADYDESLALKLEEDPHAKEEYFRALRASLQETVVSEQVVRNFIDRCVRTNEISA